MKKLGGVLIGAVMAVLLACASRPPDGPQSPAAKPFDYMTALREKEQKLKDATGPTKEPEGGFSPPRSMALQFLGVARSMVGDTVGAQDAFDETFGIKAAKSTERATAAENEARDIVAHYAIEDALAVIVREARDRQIVMINEAHHVPRHRAFALQVALELRKLGFEYLAMETLYENVAALNARKYPVHGDGYYSDEPLFGDYIRQSLAAGYTLVAYEEKYDPNFKPTDPIDRIVAREEAQAENLVARIFSKNPKARVLIHAGYGHIAKGETDMSGNRKIPWMAERLKRKTGIDPLCIDQTEKSALLTRAVTRMVFESHAGDSVVLTDHANSSVHWPEIDIVEMQVLHRAERTVDGRPDWLAMGGYRRPHPIPAELMPKTGLRLVQALNAGESADAVPVDQVVVNAGEPVPVFMLPKGKFRFAYQD